MPLYFAYGSNMLARQMAARCPGARPVGRAELGGWRFHITTRGTANIIPAPDACVHGVLWRCEAWHLMHLDRWEGVSWRNYRRRMVRVRLDDGADCSAVCYVSSRNYGALGRADYLLSAVLPGARAFALPEPFIAELESWLPRRPIGGSMGRFSRRYVGARRKLARFDNGNDLLIGVSQS